VFSTNVARLRGLERADLAPMLRWLNDDEVQRRLLRRDATSMAEHERWYEALMRSTVEVVFAVDDVSADTAGVFVGTCGLHRIDWRNRHASLSLVIGDVRGRGHGVGGAALDMVCRHAFENLGLHRVELEVAVDNDPAIRCYERAGFVREGTRRDAVFIDGAFADLHSMAVLAPTWRSSSSSKTSTTRALTTKKTSATATTTAARRGRRTSG
jgi:RimJ/RimL family protein N-acetyltransferase